MTPVLAASVFLLLTAGVYLVLQKTLLRVVLGLGLVSPIVEPAPDRKHQRRGHVNEDVPLIIGASGLDDQDRSFRISAKTIGECATGRATTHYDVVEGIPHTDAQVDDWRPGIERRLTAKSERSLTARGKRL